MRSSVSRVANFMAMPPASPSSAEVGGLDVRALPERGRGAAEYDPAGFQPIGAGRDGQRHARILLYQQDRDLPLAIDRLHDGPDLADDQGGQAERRLVQHEHGRARHQRAADREHLLLAPAERARELASPLAEPGESLEDLGERALDGPSIAPPGGAHPEGVSV